MVDYVKLNVKMSRMFMAKLIGFIGLCAIFLYAFFKY